MITTRVAHLAPPAAAAFRLRVAFGLSYRKLSKMTVQSLAFPTIVRLGRSFSLGWNAVQSALPDTSCPRVTDLAYRGLLGLTSIYSEIFSGD